MIRLSWQRILLAGLIALHLAILSSHGTGWLDPLFHDAVYTEGRGVDFFSIYEGGARLRQGENAYDPSATGRTPYAYPYRYVPAFLPLAMAFTLLPAWTVYWLWAGVLEALLVANVVGTWRLARGPGPRLAATALWLLPAPYYLELYMGQFSLLMGTLIFWSGVAFSRGRGRAAGLAWAASLFVKSCTLLAVPGLWRLGRRRLVAGALLALLVLNAPYFLLMDGAWARFSEVNGGSFATVEVDHAHAGNLGFQALLRQAARYGEAYGAWHPAVADHALPLLWAAATGAVVTAVSLLQGRRDAVLTLALAVSGYFLMFRDVWEHQYVMLLAVCALLVLERPSLRRWAWWCGVALALPTPFLALEVLYGTGPDLPPDQGWPLAAVLAYHSVKAVPALALFCRVAWELRPVALARRSLRGLPEGLRAGGREPAVAPEPSGGVTEAAPPRDRAPDPGPWARRPEGRWDLADEEP
ncbi:MAG TPA: glycosyltransferase family 87 protein [Dehalococcoidia bacterium]